MITNKNALGINDTCEMLNISKRTLYNWRVKGTGPVYHKIGIRRIVYYKSDIDEWISNTRTNGYI